MPLPHPFITKLPATDKAPTGIRFAKIQEIAVGERTIGEPPKILDEERQHFFPDPDPATWRKLTLEMLKPDGKRLDITLLRLDLTDLRKDHSHENTSSKNAAITETFRA